MTERRYSEDEVAAIFATAAQAEAANRRPISTGAGMTLAELQDIGREAGIAPEAVAQAAAMVGVHTTPTYRRFLRLPLGVGHTVELGRQLTDGEWERLVVDLRETFDARGRVSAHGSFRQWTNGNLQALLEPGESGHRLRLKTVKGDARSLMLAGLGIAGGSAVALVAATLGVAGIDSGSLGPAMGVGLGLFGLGAVRLPTWARRRREQMVGVIERLLAGASGTGRPADQARLSDGPDRPITG